MPEETNAATSPPRSASSGQRNWKLWAWRLQTPVVMLAVGVVLLVLLGLAQRWGWISAGGTGTSAVGAAATDQIYTCAMHPQIRQPRPGNCPICGMALVPAASRTQGELDELSIKIETAQRRLAGIETAVVRRAPLTDTVQSIGVLAIDESRMATISSYIKGRIERLFADYTGVDVAQGDHLAVVYSPQLYSAQVEYLEAQRTFAGMSSSTLAVVRETQQKLVASARRRLVELGMTEEQLSELQQSGQAQSRLTIYAPMGGTVVEKLAVEGMYVEAGEPIYRIADLSTVWLMLELFPEDASTIRFGQRVQAEMQSLPGKELQGRVAFIDPTVDAEKRTVGVRVEFLNDDRRLRPGDYASAAIEVPIGATGDVYDSDLAGRWISPMHPQIIRDEPGKCPICGMDLVSTARYGYSDEPVAQPEALHVPRQAVLMAGSSSVIYVETEPGRFEIRPVTLGPILRDKVVILTGVKEGEKVATAGNFLIDSQMQLAGNPSVIDPGRAVAAQREPQGPLALDADDRRIIKGDTGQRLEALYDAYLEVQQTLAADHRPSAEQAGQLHELASSLVGDEQLPHPASELLNAIASKSEHLHHLELRAARLEAFRPVSHAVLKLAATLRGESASGPMTHAFCPMVEGGAGDWMQRGGDLLPDQLRNPYWGAQMLTCGEVVDVLPPSLVSSSPSGEE